MSRKKIAREKEACGLLACGKTKFRFDYRLNDPADPFVPGTKIPRLKPIHLGPRNIGFLESEIEKLIDALAACAGTLKSFPKPPKIGKTPDQRVSK